MDTTKLKIGPANVYLEEGGVDVNIGFTNGQITFESEVQTIDLVADQLGTTPIDKIVTGASVMITVPLAEISLESFKRAMATAKTFVDDVDDTKRRLEIHPNAGQSLRALSKKLTIKPIDGGAETTNKERWIIAPIASPDATTVSIAFGNSDQQGIEAKFVCFPDVDNGNRMVYMGDETADDADESGIANV